MREIRLLSGVKIKIQMPAEERGAKGGKVRSDRLPPVPANIYVGTMETLNPPEPIKPRPKAPRRKSK
jgi:hypothetical protein